MNIGVKGYRYNLGRYEKKEEAIKARKKAEEYVRKEEIEKLKEMSKSVTRYQIGGKGR